MYTPENWQRLPEVVHTDGVCNEIEAVIFIRQLWRSIEIDHGNFSQHGIPLELCFIHAEPCMTSIVKVACP